MDRHRILPYIALVASILALTMSSFFMRFADAPPTISGFYRTLTASIILLPLIIIAWKKNPAKNTRSLYLPVAAGFFNALDITLWGLALFATFIADATLLNNLSVIWIALFSWLVWKNRLHVRFWIGLVLTLVGTMVVLGFNMIFHPDLSYGDFLAIISSFCYAGYFLATQKSRAVYPTMLHVGFATFAACFGLFLINLITNQPFTGYSLQTIGIFILSALVSQIGGFFCLVYALGKLPAYVVAPTMVFIPVFAALLAIPLFGEHLSIWAWLGVIIVILGILLVNMSSPTPQKK